MKYDAARTNRADCRRGQHGLGLGGAGRGSLVSESATLPETRSQASCHGGCVHISSSMRVAIFPTSLAVFVRLLEDAPPRVQLLLRLAR